MLSSRKQKKKEKGFVRDKKISQTDRQTEQLGAGNVFRETSAGSQTPVAPLEQR